MSDPEGSWASEEGAGEALLGPGDPDTAPCHPSVALVPVANARTATRRSKRRLVVIPPPPSITSVEVVRLRQGAGYAAYSPLHSAKCRTASEELRVRLKAERPGQLDEQRARLRMRLDRLAELYSWGDLTEPEYRKQRSEVENRLVALPTNDKLVPARSTSADRDLYPGRDRGGNPLNRFEELIHALVERINSSRTRP